MSAKKTASAIPDAKLALYDKLLAAEPDIERKGATIPYTSTNGKMFTYLTPSGDLRLRLPEDARAAFMKKYGTKPVVQHGVLMKDWVAVPTALSARVAELKPFLEKSRIYAAQLGTKSGTTRATPGRPARPPAAPAPARRSTSSRSRTAATGSRRRA
jgi:hypothetical protein